MKSTTMHTWSIQDNPAPYIYVKAGGGKKMTSSHFHIVISIQSYHIIKSPNQMFWKNINEI